MVEDGATFILDPAVSGFDRDTKLDLLLGRG